MLYKLSSACHTVGHKKGAIMDTAHDADGYYDEDFNDDEELDLSFLDEDESK